MLRGLSHNRARTIPGTDNTVATLIPAIGACTFDTTGERRLAERLEHKLDDDYLL